MPSHRTPADGAFTILEILVAMSVFLLMALMVVSLVDGTMRTTSQSQRRISADAGTRQALDRMTADFSHAIVRADLPFRIGKNEVNDSNPDANTYTNNDSITFFAQAEGYTPGRGISMIGYRVVSNSLQRGVEAIPWTGNANAIFTTLSNAATNANYLKIDEANYEAVATDVFRLEFAFLMGAGAISNAVGTNSASSPNIYVASMASSPRASTTNTIRGVIVGVAALDARARNALTNGPALPDAASGNDILTGWDASYTDATLPLPVRESLRIYQRTFLLNN